MDQMSSRGLLLLIPASLSWAQMNTTSTDITLITTSSESMFGIVAGTILGFFLGISLAFCVRESKCCSGVGSQFLYTLVVIPPEHCIIQCIAQDLDKSGDHEEEELEMLEIVPLHLNAPKDAWPGDEVRDL